MNFKKFISGVSAFAIAASAFAAMAVNASATDYTNVTPTAGKVINLTASGTGTYSVSNTNVAAVVADLSNLTDIEQATSVTVQFDTNVPSVTSGGRTYIAPVVFGVGDKEDRGYTGNGSTKGNYVKDGLIAYFGAEDKTSYYINGGSTNYATSVAGVDVRATITLDRTTGAYTGKVQTSKATLPLSGTTDVDNLTVIEAFTSNAPAAFDFTFKNIKVSYTVPDAPAPVSVDLDVTNQEAFTGTGDSKAVIVNSAFSGVDTIGTLTIEADGTEKTFVNGTDFDFDTNFGGSDAEIAVIVNNVSVVTAIAIN